MMRHDLSGFRLAAAAAVAITLLAAAPLAAQPTSAEVMTCAKTTAAHPWHFAPANATASCAPAYRSIYVEGDHMGLPYDWGGYMTLHTFDNGIQSGLGAGSYPGDGILDCTVGLDCSGFVSQCWNVGHYTTSSIPNIARAITIPQLKRGDVMNEAGYHVALFDHLQPDGRPFFYEAIGYNVHQTFNQGWAYFSGYTPRRYLSDSDDPTIVAQGTATDPFVISSFPFTDRRDTRQSMSDMFDYCNAAPTTRETGGEFVYQLEVTTPGRLTVTLSDDVNTDIDLHLYEALNEFDCVARHNSTIDVQLDCGVYYLVADTWSDGATEWAGIYDIVADFAPSTTACGAGHAYEFLGELAGPCGFAGNPDLPYCNQNLGTTACLSTGSTPSDTSFCSVECATNSDCAAAFPGGCCADIGSSEFFCLPASFCATTPDDVSDTSLPDFLTRDTIAVDTVNVPDEGVFDTATPDTSVPTDATAQDAGGDARADTGAVDTGAVDTTPPRDTAVPADTATPDDGLVRVDTEPREPGGGDEGCGCRVTSPATTRPWASGWWVAFGSLGLLWRRRRARTY